MEGKSKLEKFYDDLDKKFFPGGKKQREKEAQAIIKLSNNKLNFDESLNILLGTSALFSIAEDRDENRIIEYLNKKANRKLNKEEAKAIFNFITSKFFVKDEKLKVSKEQFAEALCIWLSKEWNVEVIKKIAKELHFGTKNIKDFIKISQELFFLNVWSIICACEAEFVGGDKRNKCLDIFFNLVYKRHPERTEKSFSTWMEEIKKKCIEYDKALETNLPTKISRLINQNLGRPANDIRFLLDIYPRIVFSTKHLRELIRKFEIE